MNCQSPCRTLYEHKWNYLLGDEPMCNQNDVSFTNGGSMATGRSILAWEMKMEAKIWIQSKLKNVQLEEKGDTIRGTTKFIWFARFFSVVTIFYLNDTTTFFLIGRWHLVTSYITLTLSKRQTVGRDGQVSLFHASLPPHLDLSHFLLLFILWKFKKKVKKSFSRNTPTTFNAIIIWRKGKTKSATVNDN